MRPKRPRHGGWTSSRVTVQSGMTDRLSHEPNGSVINVRWLALPRWQDATWPDPASGKVRGSAAGNSALRFKAVFNERDLDRPVEVFAPLQARA